MKTEEKVLVIYCYAQRLETSPIVIEEASLSNSWVKMTSSEDKNQQSSRSPTVQ